MARIKLGPLITDISGSIGMATIQRNRYGHTFRLKPLPKKSETTSQYNVRHKLISLQNSWRELSPEKQLMWQRFVNYSGQTIRKDKSVLISGYNLFLKYQLLLLLYDQSILTDIAFTPLPSVPVTSGISSDGSIFLVHFSAEINPATLFFILKMGPSSLGHNKFSSKTLRFMKVDWGIQSDFDIMAPYINAFGIKIPELSFVSYSVQFFSTISPITSGIFTGVFEVLYDL